MGYLTEANIDGSDYKLAGALWGTCTTQAATAAKVVSCADFDDFEAGVTIAIAFTYANTAAATLNVNSKGAKNAYSAGTSAPQWAANSVVTFTYNGTNWIQNDYQVNTDTKNTAGIDSSASKMYLVGSTTAPTSGTNGTARTYANSNVYATNGTLYALHVNATTFNDVAINRYNDPGIVIADSQDANTRLCIPHNCDYDLGDACEKGVDTSIASGSTSTNLPTTAAVRAYVDQVAGAAAAGALVYQGTVGANHGDVSDLPAAHTKGWYYVVADAGTYAGEACEVGDMIICNNTGLTASNDDWDVIQTNIVSLTTAEIDADWAAA